MQRIAELSVLRTGPSADRSLLVREGGRALIVFGLYIAVFPLWQATGAHLWYERIIVVVSSVVVLATQHFPIYATLENLRMNHLDNVVVLTLCLLVVSTRLTWGQRATRFGALLIAICVFHFAGFVLEAKIDAASRLAEEHGLLIYLPWELRVVDGFKYFFVDFGLNLAPFAVMLLGVGWNSGISLSVPGRNRSSAWAMILTGLVLAVCFLGIMRTIREGDPRHLRAHVQLGQLFQSDRQWDRAVEQYSIALRHGSTDGEAWYNLARIHAGRGRAGEAIGLLRRGLQVVQDETWRKRLGEAMSSLVADGR